MRRFFLSAGRVAGILLFTGVACAQDAGPPRQQPARPEVIPDRYIVQLRPGAEPVDAVQRLANQHGLRIQSVYRYALTGFSAIIPAARVEAVRRDPDVLLVEPDLRVHATVQTLPTGVNRIDADRNSIANIDGVDVGVNVDIAIIDTGVDLDHPDLNVYRYTDCVDLDMIGWLFGITCIDDNDPLNDGTLGDDLNGHGSHVAGIAAARDNDFGVVGVAPGARVWSVAVLDQNGSGFLSWVINGIDWVASHADEIDVANMSLAWVGNSAAARTAVQNTVNRGVVIVAAAGNSTQDIYGADRVFGTGDEFEPASYPEVAAVSALADSDGQAGGAGAGTTWGSDDTLASFSNFSTNVVGSNPVSSPGAAIDVAAPGVAIYSTYKNGGYATLSGTSMASPHVAGAFGLHIAANGRASNASQAAFIRQQIINAAQPQTSWGPADTRDPDSNREWLVLVGAGGGQPSNLPAAPTNLTATAGGGGKGRNATPPFIDLVWQDNSSNETSFVIERCTVSGKGGNRSCGPFAQLSTVGADQRTFRDLAVSSGTTYRYQVKSRNSFGDSPPSNTVEIKAP